MAKMVNIFIVRTDGSTKHDQCPVDSLSVYQNAVGGYIEVVPSFTKCEINGKIENVITLCDEEGKLKNKPVNMKATELWHRNLGHIGIDHPKDFLVGDIAFVYGDPKVMAEF